MQVIWPKPNRSVGLLDALGIIGLLGLLTARFIPVAKIIPFWGCGFRQMTGWPCPGCGLTRVADHFAHFHFKAAFMANPLGFLAALAFALAVVATVLHLGFKVTLPELHLDEREWVWLRNGLIGAVVVNYAVVIVIHRYGPLW
jgi:Protein of unknown function (DUF2752)